MDWLLRRLSRAGFRHGMAGEHWAWLVLAAAAYLLRRARRDGHDPILSRRLHPGERYLVTLSGPGGRRGGSDTRGGEPVGPEPPGA